MNLRESINKVLRIQELHKGMMWHLQNDPGPEPEPEKFGAAELEKLYGKSAQMKQDISHPEIHRELISRGFTHFPDAGGYHFYRKDDHVISVNQNDGKWIKSTKGKGRTLGTGAGDLRRYFNQYGNR